nr:reverse transcriptase domain-containing protein [Tanacetum cinerariifolium]
MRTRSRSRSHNNSPQREASPAIVEPLRIEFPFLEDQFQEDTPPESPMVDNRTMAQLLQVPTEGYGDAIVIPEITANNFELKHGLINLCQPKNHDYYHEQNSCRDSNPIGFDQFQPQQYTVNHPIINAHNDYLNSQKKLTITLTKVTEQMTLLTSMCELACQIVQKKLEEKQLEEEQAAKAQNWKLFVCYDDNDDEERSLGDKIICDLIKTPDLSQRPPQNCPKCGNPVDGQYCQGCAFLRKKFKEDLFTYCIENGILQDSSEPSNDNTNVVNALQELFVVKQDPDGNSFTYDSRSNLVHDSPNILDPPPQPPLYSCEFCGNDARYGHYCTPQVSFIYPEPKKKSKLKKSKRLKFDIGRFPFATMMTMTRTIPLQSHTRNNSLRMGDEYLDTILATKSNKFIKSSVENLVPIPSESEGEHECDVPACEVFTTFSNILFDANYDFSSSDDQSFYDEDIPKEIYSNPLFDEEIISMKIDPHHFNAESDLIESLFNHDSSIISSSIISSSKIDSLFDEFVGELTLLKSIPPGIKETDCDPEEEIPLIKRLLYDNSSPYPPEEFISENSDAAFESFSPSPIPVEDSDSLMEEIDLSFTPDDPMPPGIEEDDYDSKRDILILEELLSNYSLSLPKSESFHFDIPSSSRPPAKPPDENSGFLNVKVMGDISEHKKDFVLPVFISSASLGNHARVVFRAYLGSFIPAFSKGSRDIPILEELLDNYSLSLPTNESYHFDIPSPYCPPAKPPDGNTGTLNTKMMGDVPDQKVHIPNLTITRILNKEKSPDLLSHQGLEAFQPSAECPMIINGKNIPLLDVSLFHFYPP